MGSANDSNSGPSITILVAQILAQILWQIFVQILAQILWQILAQKLVDKYCSGGPATYVRGGGVECGRPWNRPV